MNTSTKHPNSFQKGAKSVLQCKTVISVKAVFVIDRRGYIQLEALQTSSINTKETSDRISRTEEKHVLWRTLQLRQHWWKQTLWSMKITDRIWSITADRQLMHQVIGRSGKHDEKKVFLAQKLQEEPLKASLWWFGWKWRNRYKALETQREKIFAFFLHQKVHPFCSGVFPL